jgi:hypothetical protein
MHQKSSRVLKRGVAVEDVTVERHDCNLRVSYSENKRKHILLDLPF